ncbi:DUF4233 domain-containing protein [Salininema proteolyticum]|uniref:DUF4233 domain-containing protein n=1 Tax=Salininema proteolyticum TaxID=1607685 RepID=A0ABV8U0X2_9ACTN
MSEQTNTAENETVPDAERSGLNNPKGAARGLAAAGLMLEGLALLMGIVPMKILLPDPGLAMWALGVLAVVCFVLTGLSGKKWVWPVGMGVQVVLVALWPVHAALGISGLVFALVWGYCWHVRNLLYKAPRREELPARR